jgi:succinoglycan biosynthesis protein ExoO
MAAEPIVSVIVAARNAARFIDDALLSARRQSLAEIEILVVDDCSTDDTRALVLAHQATDPRVVLLYGTGKGPGAARNVAINAAKGEFLAVLDADDLMHPDRLRALVDSARRDVYDIVADNLLMFHTPADAGDPGLLLEGDIWSRPCSIDLPSWLRGNTLFSKGPALGYLKPLLRRRLLAEARIRYDETLRIGEDFDLVARLLAAGARFGYVPDPGYFYRRHRESTSFRMKTAEIDALIRAADQLHPRLNQESAASSSIRRRSLLRARYFSDLLDRLKQGRLVAASLALLAHPASAPLLAASLASTMRRRLRDRLQPSVVTAQEAPGRVLVLRGSDEDDPAMLLASIRAEGLIPVVVAHDGPASVALMKRLAILAPVARIHCSRSIDPDLAAYVMTPAAPVINDAIRPEPVRGVTMPSCKIAACCLLLAGLSGVATAASAPDCPPPQPASRMVKTFESDFAKTGSMDPAQWQTLVGQHGTVKDELEAFVPDAVSVMKSVGLRLITDRQERWGHPFTSGAVTTQGLFSQTYGHFEFLAKMPQANGMWPALWLLPANGTWPPEIDILEYIYAPWGHMPSRAAHQHSTPETTLHWVDITGTKREMGPGNHSDVQDFATYEDWATTPPPPGVGPGFAGYHTYSIDWRPASLVWFIDDQPTFCMIDNPGTGRRIPDTPMFIIIDDAVTSGTSAHPGWPGFVAPEQKFPLALDIAEVRVAQFKDLTPAPPLPLDISGVTLSAETARPGDTVHITATIQTGDADLGDARDAKMTLRRFDMTQYTGVGDPVATMRLPLQHLAARRRYPVSVSYTVSRVLPPGLYSVSVSLGYSAGPPNGPGAGRWAELRQARVLSVLAP